MALRSIRLSIVSLFLIGTAVAAETFEAAVKEATANYRERARQAAAELHQTRERIANERAPYYAKLRGAEDRVIAAESETVRLQTEQQEAADTQRKLLREIDTIRKTTSYVSTQAQESLKALRDGLVPGEEQFVAERLESLQRELGDARAGSHARAAIDAVEFMLERTRQMLGGHAAAGEAMSAETSQMLRGTFAFVGPETFFLPAQGEPAGTVRTRAGSAHPVSFRLEAWKPEHAAAFFQGHESTLLVDASAGKALRLQETRGTILEHIHQGGVVSYVIVAVGVLALIMILQKLRDVARMRVDTPQTVRAALGVIGSGTAADAERAVSMLRPTTRELFAAGLAARHLPQARLEEHLQAVLLRQRLFFERRLPLLAVIATAAPLMGLLGTVVGMVKTFALITVFGTGDAGKLSSGISEVLVATELGLAVAIPTLVIHGFLAHRVHKNLALLEQYALQFVTAAETAKADADRTGEKESVTA